MLVEQSPQLLVLSSVKVRAGNMTEISDRATNTNTTSAQTQF